MAMKKFVRVHITASHDEEMPIENYLLDDDGTLMSKRQIEEWVEENSAEILLEDDWAMWDIDVRIFEREVPDAHSE